MLEGPPRIARVSVRAGLGPVVVSLALATFASPALADPGDPPERIDHPSDPHERDSGSAPIRIGALAGVSLPRPLSVEGMVKLDDVVALGLEYSVLPKLSVSGVDATFNAIAGDLRVFPLKSGFFIGLAGGRQHVGASTVITLPASLGSLAFPEQVTADTWFINPRIGFLSTWSWGLTVGFDVGVQIPISATFTNTIPTQLTASQDATNVAHFFGKSVLPTVDLLKIGFLF